MRARPAATAASRLTPESWLARAVIAAEDQRFYEHGGYDLAELGAALAQNQDSPDEGRAGRGASTLTQQLAKLLVTGDERSPARKLRELLYAVEMEQTLGKNRILRLYLAHAPWGNGICGAEAAVKTLLRPPGDCAEARRRPPGWPPCCTTRRWKPNAGRSTGQINVARTQWVLMGMRALPRQQRLRLAKRRGNWHGPRRFRNPDGHGYASRQRRRGCYSNNSFLRMLGMRKAAF